MSFFQTGVAALRAVPNWELAPLILLPIWWIGGFLLFLLLAAIRGMPRTERIARTRSRALPLVIMEYGYWQLRLPLWILRKLHFSPDLVTFLSVPLALVSAIGFGMGRFMMGGWMLAAAIACDALDGILARELGTSSDRGEFFDSIIDRYVDFIISFGLLYYYRNDPVPAALVVLGIIGSQVMGYAKAKGEACGVDPKIGWMQRHERSAYLIIATTIAPIVAAFVEPFSPHPQFHSVLVALVAIAVFSNVSAIARTGYVMKRMPRVGPFRPAAATTATHTTGGSPAATNPDEPTPLVHTERPA